MSKMRHYFKTRLNRLMEKLRSIRPHIESPFANLQTNSQGSTWSDTNLDGKTQKSDGFADIPVGSSLQGSAIVLHAQIDGLLMQFNQNVQHVNQRIAELKAYVETINESSLAVEIPNINAFGPLPSVNGYKKAAFEWPPGIKRIGAGRATAKHYAAQSVQGTIQYVTGLTYHVTWLTDKKYLAAYQKKNGKWPLYPLKFLNLLVPGDAISEDFDRFKRDMLNSMTKK